MEPARNWLPVVGSGAFDGFSGRPLEPLFSDPRWFSSRRGCWRNKKARRPHPALRSARDRHALRRSLEAQARGRMWVIKTLGLGTTFRGSAEVFVGPPRGSLLVLSEVPQWLARLWTEPEGKQRVSHSVGVGTSRSLFLSSGACWISEMYQYLLFCSLVMVVMCSAPTFLTSMADGQSLGPTK